eukprot:TRINITY_DN2004_c0_g1_i1.p1 TRINITY_DN2004_c0_g1~~TRINITY_DN2004_c0_g1_i1.p1  ORF type:complete len:405 (+),score=31.12 TRINITY_DN2004_c0_g1_i1:340-1554(+)
MSTGRILMLVNCSHLYESLYDLLNQHYVEYNKRRYTRLSYGANNSTYTVNDKFRCVVVVSNTEVISLPPPFLNRFEKQCLGVKDIMGPAHNLALANLSTLLTLSVNQRKTLCSTPHEKFSSLLLHCLPAFAPFSLHTLVLAANEKFKNEMQEEKQQPEDTGDAINLEMALRSEASEIENTAHEILWPACSTSSMAYKAAKLCESGDSVLQSLLTSQRENYFSTSCHDSLEGFLSNSPNLRLALLLTYHPSAITNWDNIGETLSKALRTPLTLDYIALETIPSEQFFVSQLNSFLHKDTAKHFFIIGCDFSDQTGQQKMTTFQNSQYLVEKQCSALPSTDNKHCVLFLVHLPNNSPAALFFMKTVAGEAACAWTAGGAGRRRRELGNHGGTSAEARGRERASALV